VTPIAYNDAEFLIRNAMTIRVPTGLGAPAVFVDPIPLDANFLAEVLQAGVSAGEFLVQDLADPNDAVVDVP
jgi:hypothetical protein